MATPEQARERTWRFRLNDATTLEVSLPRLATEKQIRRRGRWSLILGTLVAAAVLVTVASAADDGSVDGDVRTPGNQNSVSIATNAGATVNTGAGFVIERAGNQAHLAVRATWSSSSTTLQHRTCLRAQPSAMLRIDSSKPLDRQQGKKSPERRTSRSPPPRTSTSYTVKWKVKSGPTCINASGNADCLNISGAFTIDLTITAPPSNTPPSITVTGVAHGATYEIGSCSDRRVFGD